MPCTSSPHGPRVSHHNGSSPLHLVTQLVTLLPCLVVVGHAHSPYHVYMLLMSKKKTTRAFIKGRPACPASPSASSHTSSIPFTRNTLPAMPSARLGHTRSCLLREQTAYKHMYGVPPHQLPLANLQIRDAAPSCPTRGPEGSEWSTGWGRGTCLVLLPLLTPPSSKKFALPPSSLLSSSLLPLPFSVVANPLRRKAAL